MENRLKEIRKERGMSQEVLAERVGAVKSQISKLEKGVMRLNDKWIERLSGALHCTPAELFSQTSEQMIPVIGDVPGGDLAVAIEQPVDDYVPFGKKLPRGFALRVRGNSMSRIAADGAYVIVDDSQTDPNLLANQPVILSIETDLGHECSFKIFKQNPERFEPYSIEAGYDTIFPNGRQWRIYGKVVGVVGYVGDDANLLPLSDKVL